MELGENLISWSARASLACYAAVVVGNRLARPTPTRWNRNARTIWLLGCVFMLAHMVAAYHFVHHWSHAHAVADTARKTNELLGVEFGEGVWFNYVFVVVWMLDALWRLPSREYVDHRLNRLRFVMHAYMALIVVNGAIIFESGPTRWIGVTIVLFLTGHFALKR